MADTTLPDAWIGAHPDQLLHYRRDEAEPAADSRDGVAPAVARLKSNPAQSPCGRPGRPR